MLFTRSLAQDLQIIILFLSAIDNLIVSSAYSNSVLHISHFFISTILYYNKEDFFIILLLDNILPRFLFLFSIYLSVYLINKCFISIHRGQSLRV